MFKVAFVRSGPVAPEPRVEKDAIALGKNGYIVDILGWDRTCTEKKIEKKPYYTIKRINLKAPFGKPSLIPKLICWSLLEMIYLFRSNADIIHACDLDTLIPALIVSKLKKKLVVYDSFDFYAHGISNRIPKILMNLLEYLEIISAMHSDYVILADESRIEQFKFKLKKFITIVNSPDLDNAIKFKDETNSQFTIFYGGILDKNRGLNQLIEAVEGLSDVSIRIAGYGLHEDYLLKEFNKSNRIVFLGKIPYEKIIKETLECDLVYALYNPLIINNKYASPNKLFEAMMCKKPIIVSKYTNMAKIVEDEKCGLLVDYNNINELRNAVIILKENVNLRNELGQNGRESYDAKYNWQIMESKLLSMYSNLLEGYCRN